MSIRSQLVESILKTDKNTFEDIAFKVFEYQYINNSLYHHYCKLLKILPGEVKTLRDIPFLPISFFKTHQVQSGNWAPEIIFKSSGTSGITTSSHYIKDLHWYEQIALKGFQHFYSEITDYCFLALLPSYLERKDSSLVYMAQKFMESSLHPQNGFYLNDLESLRSVLSENYKNSVKTILLGVTFALLDLSEQFPFVFSDLIVMETGGMKGRRKEMTREEVHFLLKKAFCVPAIHSEYGMTELLSQAYSSGDGIFNPTPTMMVFVRDPTDPFSHVGNGKTGCLSIIDLGNLDSCSFIATDDLGKLYQNGSFEVIGRLDQADIRGCNLLVT